MRSSTVISIATLLVLVATTEIIRAEDDCPPVVYKSTGAECELTCGSVIPENPFDKVFCAPGYYCKPGYIREYFNGPCIPESECPEATTVQPEATTVQPEATTAVQPEATTLQPNANL